MVRLVGAAEGSEPRELASLLGIGAHMALRHTHATLGLAAGIHPNVMQERLGHSSIAVTLDLYSHAIPALGADAADRIAAVVDGF